MTSDKSLRVEETARNIEIAAPEFPRQNPQLPWSPVQGMRHRLAHGYYKVNLDPVMAAAERYVPPLLAQLKSIRIRPVK